MMFDCPVCGSKHSVPDNYGHEDYECPNTSRNPKVFQDLVPIDILSKNNMMNTASTKIDEARPVTVEDIKPSYKQNGLKIGEKATNW